MDPAYLSGRALFWGSVVGALSSLASTWPSKARESSCPASFSEQAWAIETLWQFIDEASKLYVDALIRGQGDPSALVSVYALISKMRMASDPSVIENAETVIAMILGTYSHPNKTFRELRGLTLNRGFVDPLLRFSEICRDELRDTLAIS